MPGPDLEGRPPRKTKGAWSQPTGLLSSGNSDVKLKALELRAYKPRFQTKDNSNAEYRCLRA
jgi:hypothetical protein